MQCFVSNIAKCLLIATGVATTTCELLTYREFIIMICVVVCYLDRQVTLKLIVERCQHARPLAVDVKERSGGEVDIKRLEKWGLLTTATLLSIYKYVPKTSPKTKFPNFF